jgi:hypothetical protein
MAVAFLVFGSFLRHAMYPHMLHTMNMPTMITLASFEWRDDGGYAHPDKRTLMESCTTTDLTNEFAG